MIRFIYLKIPLKRKKKSMCICSFFKKKYRREKFLNKENGYFLGAEGENREESWGIGGEISLSTFLDSFAF